VEFVGAVIGSSHGIRVQFHGITLLVFVTRLT